LPYSRASCVFFRRLVSSSWNSFPPFSCCSSVECAKEEMSRKCRSLICLLLCLQFIFKTRDPILVGVKVESGIVKEGTPLCVPSKEVSYLIPQNPFKDGGLFIYPSIFNYVYRSHRWDLILKNSTPDLIFGFQFVDIGVVSSIKANDKPVQTARKGQEVSIQILPIPGQDPRMLGRHFEIQDMLVSKVRFFYRTFC
jgi:hypothetical protein